MAFVIVGGRTGERLCLPALEIESSVETPIVILAWFFRTQDLFGLIVLNGTALSWQDNQFRHSTHTSPLRAHHHLASRGCCGMVRTPTQEKIPRPPLGRGEETLRGSPGQESSTRQCDEFSVPSVAEAGDHHPVGALLLASSDQRSPFIIPLLIAVVGSFAPL